ncbi:hypothetical protein QQF64_013077 [Cirrhinus molitorella]|uniref:Uncharacterized protein n=1 Tax=Cirrhinus molitorella TaxID=172907 RepID=A0ABR3LSE0_9TELE
MATPERQGGGDGNRSKWNYAFLVPMLGLAAFVKMNDLNARRNQMNIRANGNGGNDKWNWNWNWLLLIPLSGLALHQWFMQKKIRNEIVCLRRSIEKDRREDKAMVVIHEIRRLLYARQEIICSSTVPYFAQQTREQELTSMASTDPIACQLNINADLLKIFQHPEPCSRATINSCVEDWQKKLKDLLENETKID